MDQNDDRELLTAYARDGTEEAFAILTRRYLDLVYSAAMRQVHNPEQARDVTQAVFLLLARKAGTLAPGVLLGGWLYRTTRFVSMEAVRAEKRRRIREESMAEFSIPRSEHSREELWTQVSPHLDEAMEQLSDVDRNAIVLRFFQDRPLRQLASTLGVSEEAAKKRVSRALEKLRVVMARKGIRSSSSLLGAVLAASAVQPTPSVVAAVILPSLVAKGGAAWTAQVLAKGAIHMMTYTKLQAGAAAITLLLMVAGTGYVAIENVEARREPIRLGEKQAETDATAKALDASDMELLAKAEQENRQLREEARELYRLRASVTQLRSQSGGPRRKANAAQLETAPPELKESAETLRELQYEQFVAAGQKAIQLQPLTEEERNEYAVHINFVKNLGLALRIYASEHGDEFPPDFETILGTDLLDSKTKEQLQTGRYEYVRFPKADSKPRLPAAWWRSPDERGIRVLVMNDGSAHLIREPAGVAKPGYVELSGIKN